ncbi:Sterol regulatory element-binding protein ECM22 [Rhizoctonia solani]|uniref:Sterol regulatory element-binding protein ECM22 n=1 Tax=Rhizoctonia solani TaxID=456999 RepID=A0A0K6FZR7_9AGAM|nr:Sterol regulatory element-binding protein ECM22 [Rhizoctonia solani]
MTIRYTPRSLTGCFTCKRRKKKCDEHKPHCLRCVNGGFKCEGYPAFEGRIRRVTFNSSTDPASEQSTSGTEPPETPTNSTSVTFSSEYPYLVGSERSSDPVERSSSHGTTSLTDWSPSTQRSSAGGVPHTESLSFKENLDETQLLTVGSPRGPENFDLYAAQTPLPKSSSPRSLSLSGFGQSSLSSSSTSSNPPLILNHGQTSLLDSIFSLAHPQDQTFELVEYDQANPSPGFVHGPYWPSSPLINDADTMPYDEKDPEGIKYIICRSPTPDPNTRSNALPFVLQSYARWVNFVVFEPLKVADSIREGVIMQFASSPEVRTRICLIANVIGKLSKAPELDKKGVSIVSMLRSEAHQNIQHFHSKKPASEREIDMQSALRMLDSMMEASPLLSVIALMEAIAPVFRRACPDPPEKLVNLPNILASPGLNLQHFAATDVIISVTTARPMFFKYDVQCSPEAFARLAEGHYGLQWLHGVPDLFIVLLAWINALHEDYGDKVDPKWVAEIESQVQEVKIKPGFSPDPILLVLRLAVQECWRQTVYIYLYMVSNG